MSRSLAAWGRPTSKRCVRQFTAAGDGKMFAFCRSGNRSTLAWAVAKSEDGAPREELNRMANEAGFDLGPVAHLLRD